MTILYTAGEVWSSRIQIGFPKQNWCNRLSLVPLLALKLETKTKNQRTIELQHLKVYHKKVTLNNNTNLSLFMRNGNQIWNFHLSNNWKLKFEHDIPDHLIFEDFFKQFLRICCTFMKKKNKKPLENKIVFLWVITILTMIECTVIELIEI